MQTDTYDVAYLAEASLFLERVRQQRQHIDCLVLEDTPELRDIFEELQCLEIFLPSVILQVNQPAPSVSSDQTQPQSELSNDPATDSERVNAANNEDLAVVDTNLADSNQSNPGDRHKGVYTTASIYLPDREIRQLPTSIDQVISEFLNLSPSCTLEKDAHTGSSSPNATTQVSLLLQQKRLAQKLKERLGYLGIYYKRNSANFLRRMRPEARQAFLTQLKLDYRKIVLNYFSGDTNLNQKIDNYVSAVFFADVPTAQVVEIHMELMDDFSKQLKIEGRSEEILLDYRLTLIDTLANLCEMYRRSIPREP